MLGKLGFAALLSLPVFGATHGSDLRQLYNAMYPVDTIRRDALDLCHAYNPTFVRALHDDRNSCYHSMPHSIAMAIGIIPPRPDAVALGEIPGAARPALFASAVLPRIRQPLDRPLQLASFADMQPAATACGAAAAPRILSMTAAMDLLARNSDTIDDATLAAIALSQRDTPQAGAATGLSVLSVGFKPAPETAGPTAGPLLGTAAALTDAAEPSAASPASAYGSTCTAPA